MDPNPDDETSMPDPEPKIVILPPALTLRDLAQVLGLKPWELTKTLIGMGLFCKADSVLDFVTAAAVCSEHGVIAKQANGK